MLVIDISFTIGIGVVEQLFQQMVLDGKFEGSANVFQFCNRDESAFLLIHVGTRIAHQREVLVVNFAKLLLH